MDVGKLKVELSEEIQGLLDKNPSMNLNEIARKINRSEGILHLISDPQSVYHPGPDIVLSLMGVVKNRQEIAEIISLSQGTIKDYLVSSFPMFINKDKFSSICSRVEFSITDRESFIIVCLCGTLAGSTRQEIISTLGILGERRLEELLKSEAIREESNGRLFTIDDNIWITPKTIRRYAGEFLHFFKEEDMNKDCSNLLYFLVESITEEYRAQIVKILFEAFAKIREGTKDPKNIGNTKFFTMVLGDTLSFPKSGGQTL